MNLNSRPSLAQLQGIFAVADDAEGHHVLWIDTEGAVHLDALPLEMGPLEFEKINAATMQMRFQTLDCGNDYVGPNAAQDLDWMRSVLEALTEVWPARLQGKVTYVDAAR